MHRELIRRLVAEIRRLRDECEQLIYHAELQDQHRYTAIRSMRAEIAHAQDLADYYRAMVIDRP